MIKHSTLWLGRGTESRLCHNYHQGIGHAPARWKEAKVGVGGGGGGDGLGLAPVGRYGNHARDMRGLG